MKRDIMLMGCARENSTRVKNKMTRSFGDSSLFELYLKRFEEVQKMKNPFGSIIMALNKNDSTLCSQAKQSSIQVVDRSEWSAGSAKLPAEVYHYLEGFNEKYVMYVNGCYGLLKPETIIKVANFFLKDKKLEALTCVKERFNWFWDIETKKPFTFKGLNDGSTELCKPIYESVHCFHIHKISNVLEKNIWWEMKENDPYLYLMEDSTEFLDVDTPVEFEIADAVWRYKHGGKK
jgi:CMP-N-acetylneuraminic acid synthetase